MTYENGQFLTCRSWQEVLQVWSTLKGQGGRYPPPSFWQISYQLTLFQKEGRLCPPNYYLPLPHDFQTFLRPWCCRCGLQARTFWIKRLVSKSSLSHWLYSPGESKLFCRRFWYSSTLSSLIIVLHVYWPFIHFSWLHCLTRTIFYNFLLFSMLYRAIHLSKFL